MSVTGVFTKGRPAGHPAATAILKYLPRPRVPWQPSRFARANLDPDDLAQLWARGRYRDGPGNYNSGYSVEKHHVLEDKSISMIPKHELEGYMPDISIGSKALVTPVSIMHARNGHRVTHDMLHSYDPTIGRLQKPAVVEHDNISVQDPNCVGLNAATLDCRGRIYRWLRRGPFFQEDHYFRRSTQLSRDGTIPVTAHEGPLIRKLIRLARRGHLKAACEEYRRITSIPPVEVYRALTAACIPSAKLADAIAIFEDGNSRLFYVARDGEVLHNLMQCAIRADHRIRVMWVYNVMRGRYYENAVVRAEVDRIWQFRIATLALEHLLDRGAAEEGRAVYQYLEEEQLLDCDVHIRLGLLMREALAEGKTVQLNNETVQGMALTRSAEAMVPQVAMALFKRHITGLKGGSSNGTEEIKWSSRAALDSPASLLSDPPAAMAWLKQSFPDIDVLSVLRLSRFEGGRKDLMARDRQVYLQRAAQWIELLSAVSQQREEAPLTYMCKSRAALTNTNVRVAWLPDRRRRNELMAHEEGYCFHYTPSQRLVDETFAYGGDSLQARYLAQQPVHVEVTAAIDMQKQQHLLSSTRASVAPTRAKLHESLKRELSQANDGGAGRSLALSGEAPHGNRTGKVNGTITGGLSSSSAAPEF